MYNQIGPLSLLVFQGTSLCNINCSYCYLSPEERSNNKKISFECVERTITELLAGDFVKGHFTVLWHAGEPLVLPIKFYVEAFDRIKALLPVNIQFTFSFQTNATLINKEWCQFIKDYDVEVGISLDGPEFINDKYRLDKAGKGTFDKTMRGITLLREYGIPVNIISVLTTYSLKYPEELFSFFHALDINSLSFNIEEIEGHNTNPTYQVLHDGQIRQVVTHFFKTFFNLHLKSGKSFKLREYDIVTQKILFTDLQAIKPFDSELTNTYSIITVDTEGNFSTFSPELISQIDAMGNSLVFGNVFEENAFTKALSSEKFKAKYLELQTGIALCKDNCSYFNVCGGGTPSNKNSEFGRFDVDETIYCNLSSKAPIDAFLELV